jgi:hypothetical protein
MPVEQSNAALITPPSQIFLIETLRVCPSAMASNSQDNQKFLQRAHL